MKVKYTSPQPVLEAHQYMAARDAEHIGKWLKEAIDAEVTACTDHEGPFLLIVAPGRGPWMLRPGWWLLLDRSSPWADTKLQRVDHRDFARDYTPIGP